MFFISAMLLGDDTFQKLDLFHKAKYHILMAILFTQFFICIDSQEVFFQPQNDSRKVLYVVTNNDLLQVHAGQVLISLFHHKPYHAFK